MYDFSASIMDLIDNIKKKSYSLDIHTIGSEYLLSELIKIEDGIFKFLMNEYDVLDSEIIEETESALILRKQTKEYSTALENIFEKASSVSLGKIKEEHLLYGILEVKNSIAYKQLQNLGLSPKDLMVDLKEIYDFKDSEKEDAKYTTNITRKALNKELDGLFEYEEYLKKLEIILNKKYKNNPLIIGEAGVGKTAIVEGFASYAIEKGLDYEILSINLSQMLSNTKYRGDFEARIDETLEYVKEHSNIILFIDEIHTIVGAGSTESSMDAANILKPFLARSDIKIIGATTLDEYHKTIYKDKALRRRFETIVVSEPNLDITKKIIEGLKPSYEEYHNINISKDILNYLVIQADNKILNKARPDKCIDVLDEVMSFAKTNKVKITTSLIDQILDQRIGKNSTSSELNFPELSKLEFLSENNLKEVENYNFHIAIYENDKALKNIKKDLNVLYGISEEMILELDMKQYQDYAQIQTLIGAPPGYVGYEEEGLLSKQINKYPLTLLILKNLDHMSLAFKMIYNRILGDGYFYDSTGNKIFTKHIILLDVIKHKDIKSVGFLKEKTNENLSYDLVIESSKSDDILNEEYKKIVNKYNLDVTFGFEIYKKHQPMLNDIIYNLVSNEDKEPHEILLKENNLILK